MSGNIKAKYISDIFSMDFKKDKVYEGLYRAKDDKRFLCFIDKDGEEYALPASRFEILEEKAE